MHFTRWPHPPYSTIHNSLTETNVSLSAWLCNRILQSKCLGVLMKIRWRVWGKGGVGSASCWNVGYRKGCVPCVCVCVCSRHLFVLSLHVRACVHACTHTQSQLPLALHSYFWPAQSAGRMGGGADGSLSLLVNNTNTLSQCAATAHQS